MLTCVRTAHCHTHWPCRAASATEIDKDKAEVVKDAPKPIVKIDNQHDPFATVVSIQYGNKLGELLDTVSNEIVQATSGLLSCLNQKLRMLSSWPC